MGGDINWVLESPAWFSVFQEYAVERGWTLHSARRNELGDTFYYLKGSREIVFHRNKLSDRLYSVVLDTVHSIIYEFHEKGHQYRHFNGLERPYEIITFESFFENVKARI